MCAKDGPSLPMVSAAVFPSVITFVKEVYVFWVFIHLCPVWVPGDVE